MKVSRNGAVYKIFSQPAPTLTLSSPGIYKATLTVTDLKGAKNSQSFEIKAGNEPPIVDLTILSGNSNYFFPGKSFKYTVRVKDREDGSLANKGILPSQVS